MLPGDGVEVVRPRHLRAVLIGAGTAAAAGLLLLLAPSPAHADNGSPGLLGDTLGSVVGVANDIVSPVVAPLPDLRSLPVAGDLVGAIADSRPVGSITAPVTGLVDGIAGDTVGSLPIVGGLLGDRPTGSVVSPITGTLDNAVSGLAGTPGTSAVTPDGSGTGTPDGGPLATVDGTDGTALGGALAATDTEASGLVAAVAALNDLPAGALALAAVAADGLGSATGEFPAVLHPFSGELSSAVTAMGSSSAAGGLAAGMLGIALLLLLARGRARPSGFRAPAAPVFDTDTSPA